ncbi:ubiquitin carboxyl-terminal hydrolase MINDY-3 [Spea bombifrons]|uniref:ubiquitin carboxyl-terminal hydrolase MINDY-3 n=1 Tax=Spea bombifrons TaxID=233779 RepID=UPI002349FEC7|nr:ubiquitin carboxyl-terminal hydrolase MINDY-3 [Spea bombifrons]XP_053322958.1 ubiquitin carboxyl-terminal hydrolase MINDY-3 [Spea bombifrons]
MSETNKELVDLVWGRRNSKGLVDSIFSRWTQGFVFSDSESTALEQFEGGPCAVIAPVQAFLLKNLLFIFEKPNWRNCHEDEQKEVLCQTLCDIMEMSSFNHSNTYVLATWLKGKTAPEAEVELPAESSQREEQPTALAAEELGFERFHALIQKRTLRSVSELKGAIWDEYSTWRNKFGVLLFLYSVILTKGIENIKNEIEDSEEPLIDPVYGHGSQSLINLLLTGHAISNVWDGDRECSGMKLLGIHSQGTVGFLTLMESLRYCKVGCYLKSPKFPIWVIGSETHLTVFFTKEMTLVAPESPSEQAKRIFQTYDPEDNGFIPDALLEDVMKALDLVSEPEYVNLMKTKLDPEGLGIILLGPFLQEFFSEQGSKVPESFSVFHYNGLKQSNRNEKVTYTEGTAVMGFEDPRLQSDDTPIKSCLQTKWPFVELLWSTDKPPSLN